MPLGAALLFDNAPPGQLSYAQKIAAALIANPAKALELMRVSHAAFDPANLPTVVNSAVNILRYNVVGLRNAQGSSRTATRTRTAAGGTSARRTICC